MDEARCKACSRFNSPARFSEALGGVGCDDCEGWYHVLCLGKTDEWLASLGETPSFCQPCLSKCEDSETDENAQEAASVRSSREEDTNNEEKAASESSSSNIAARDARPGHHIIKRD